MACASKLLFVLLAVFLGLVAEPHLTFVNGDLALLNNVCRRTSKPNYCLQCFSMNNQSRSENLKSLGRTSIDCAAVQSIDAMSTVNKFVVNATDKNFKNACVDCFETLSSGDRKITNALQSWQNGRYATAAHQILNAAQAGRACIAELQKFNPPRGLQEKILTLEGFCEASSGVLRQLH